MHKTIVKYSKYKHQYDTIYTKKQGCYTVCMTNIRRRAKNAKRVTVALPPHVALRVVKKAKKLGVSEHSVMVDAIEKGL